jgi:hypothetical protein
MTPEDLEALRARLKAQRADRALRGSTPAGTLKADLPDGWPDIARFWCSHCGLANAPGREHKHAPDPPCPRCDSTTRWYGRVADLEGTATEPPEGQCLDCYEWCGNAQHGWAWFRICQNCDCAHHADEIWMA